MARDSKGRFTAGIEISVTDSTAGPLRRLTQGLDNVERSAKKASRAFDVGNLEAIGRGAQSALEKPIRRFADFQEQMDSVTAATFDLTRSMDAAEVKKMDEAVAQLSTTARKLGSDTKYSASEAAGGMDILAKNFSGSDFEKAQAVMDAMPGILDTAAATKETIETAADVSSATMNQFGLAAKDMGLIGDVLVKTANGSATGLTDLGEALKYSGVSAHKAGVDLQTTTAMIGALGNAGKKGSVAGTGLASVLGNIQSGAKKQRSALAALGIDVTDKQGNLKPIVELLAELDKAADKKFGEGKGGVRRDRWLQGLVGMGGDKEALAILMEQAGSGELQKLVDANMNAAGTAKLVATAMSDNAVGAAKELDGAYEELQLTLGEELIPTATQWMKSAKEITVEVVAWAKENPELTRALGALAVALGVVATVTKVVTAAMMINPIVAIVTGIALAAYLLYEHWEPVKAFFQEHWAAISAVFAPFMILLGPVLAAGKLLMDNWEPIRDFFVTLWEDVTAAFKGALDWILGKIEWVGEKVEDFQISLMSADEYEAFKAQKSAEAQAAAKAVLGGDGSDDNSSSLTGRGGLGDWGAGTQATFAANNEQYAIDQIADMAGKLTGTGAYEQYGPANLSAEELAAKRQQEANEAASVMDDVDHFLAKGQPLMKGGWDPETGRRVTGEMIVTVKGDPTIVKTEMRAANDPHFAMRMNAGGQ